MDRGVFDKMSRLFMFEKPLGMRDTFPELYETKNHIRNSIENEMKRWGYQFIETPALEYYETVGAASAILDQQLFKLLDQQGHTLVLRPDMTAPIARVAASKLLKEDICLTACIFSQCISRTAAGRRASSRV